jgi:hypothetical protein
MGLEHRWLWGCSSVGRIHGSLELCDRIVPLFGSLRRSIGVAPAEIYKFWRIWYLLTGPIICNECGYVLLNIAILKGESDLLASLRM